MLKASKNSKVRLPEDICLTCGLCCNGTIFSDVRLVPSDDRALLISLGLPMVKSADPESGRKAKAALKWRFLQPCAALAGCKCRIYGSRPTHCRSFECLLLKKVKEGRSTRTAALRLIREARFHAQRVHKLLVLLGDADDGIALADRFRSTTQRIERAKPDRKAIHAYGRLTLAFHDLNRLIGESFYRVAPGRNGAKVNLRSSSNGGKLG